MKGTCDMNEREWTEYFKTHSKEECAMNDNNNRKDKEYTDNNFKKVSDAINMKIPVVTERNFARMLEGTEAEEP